MKNEGKELPTHNCSTQVLSCLYLDCILSYCQTFLLAIQKASSVKEVREGEGPLARKMKCLEVTKNSSEFD